MTVDQTRLDGHSSRTSSKPSVESVDLTSDGNVNEGTEIQRAIQLSLQEHDSRRFVSKEDEEISKALEVSYAEQKSSGKRKWDKIDIWEPANPHDRKREDNFPVGLRNMGSTCWFSSLIQALFHLPGFPSLVFSFHHVDDTSLQRRDLEFVNELRRLFAMMVGSNRKAVDPYDTIDLLKETLKGTAEEQQDVTEFLHKLLDWLESAFKTQMSSSDQVKNPIVHLFYGNFITHDPDQVNSDVVSPECTFSQCPLQVGAFTDLHQSLEAFMRSESKETDTQAMEEEKTTKEQWFTRLPPLMMFGLSRFRFNQESGTTEKVHQRFDFPLTLFMDRYLYQNQELCHLKRKEISSLVQQRQSLHERLNKYLNYGTGSKQASLPVALQLVLEYAQSQDNVTDMELGDTILSPKSIISDTMEDSPSHVAMDTCESTDATTGIPLVPNVPSHEDLHVLQSCLKHWQKNVDMEVEKMETSLEEIEKTIENIFNDVNLKQVPYQLHAVLVHEGHALSGHYWAYVFCVQRKCWLKFNDCVVTKVSWEDVLRDSVGGHNHASAYCIIYKDCSRECIFKGCNMPQLFESDVSDNIKIPEDLVSFVCNDNMKFAQEVEDWDRATVVSNNDVTVVDVGSVQTVEPTGLAREHADLSTNFTQKAVLNGEHYISQLGIDKAIRHKIIAQIGADLGRDQLTLEGRVRHIGSYMLYNSIMFLSFPYWCVLQQLAIKEIKVVISEVGEPTCLESCKKIQRKASELLYELEKSKTEEEKLLFESWHEAYKKFREVALFVTRGMECMIQTRLSLGVEYIMKAASVNDELIESNPSPGPKKGVDPLLIKEYRRFSIQLLNNDCLKNFNSPYSRNYNDSRDHMDLTLFPAFTVLRRSEELEDQRLVEYIREQWFNLVEIKVNLDRGEWLEDLLNRMTDARNEVVPVSFRPVTSIPNETDDPEWEIKLPQRLTKALKFYTDYRPTQEWSQPC